MGDGIFASVRLAACTRTNLLKGLARRGEFAKLLKDRSVYVIADEIEDWGESAVTAVCGNAPGVLFAGDFEQRLVDPGMRDYSGMGEEMRLYFEPSLDKPRPGYELLKKAGVPFCALTTTQRFGHALLMARAAMCPELQPIAEGREAPRSSGTLLELVNHIEYPTMPSEANHMKKRALPCAAMLAATALSVAALLRRYDSVCVMCVYRATAAVVEAFLREADALLPEHAWGTTSDTPLRRFVENGGVKTIRVCRGVTVEAAVLLVHRRGCSDSAMAGIWATDDGMRNVAMTRASHEMVIIADEAAMADSTPGVGRPACPGLGRLGRMFWTIPMHSAGPFWTDRWERHPRDLRHENMTPAASDIKQTYESWPMGYHWQWWEDAARRALRTRGDEVSRSMTQQLVSKETRSTLAKQAQQAMANRRPTERRAPVYDDDPLKRIVDNFNWRAQRQRNLRGARDDEPGGEEVPLSWWEREWVKKRGPALLPAVHWTLGGSNSRTIKKVQQLQHLVSIPFLNLEGEDIDEDGYEHYFMLRLACHDGHMIRLAHHKGSVVRTKYAQHFWRECKSLRVAVEATSRATGELLAHSYWGMGTRRMLDCLFGLVIRTTGKQMPIRLRQMLAKHFPFVEVTAEHVCVWEDASEEQRDLLARLCDEESARSADMGTD